jgi:hypothetical protein
MVAAVRFEDAPLVHDGVRFALQFIVSGQPRIEGGNRDLGGLS